MGDDIEAPHDGTVEVPEDASLLDLVRAILRLPRWLAAVMGGATWHISHDGAAVVFAERLLGDIVIPVGHADRSIGALDAIHVYYARQEPPQQLAARLRP